jgi:hypothetical protein
LSIKVVALWMDDLEHSWLFSKCTAREVFDIVSHDKTSGLVQGREENMDILEHFS